MKNHLVFSILAFTTLLLLAAVIGFFFMLDDLPYIPEDLRSLVYARPTEVYAADGSLVYRLGGRSYIALNQISPHFRKAVVAAEDGEFYQHHGIDKIALLRAAYRSLTGHDLQSGSTITQQLTKNLFFTFQKSYLRKVKEMLVSMQLETTFTKDQILEAYCNLVYFGGAAYGIEDAAQQFFNKPAAMLTIPEAAMLAGIVNSPGNLNPFSHYDNAKARQKLILARMHKKDFITATEMQAAAEDSLRLSRRRTRGNDFVDYVITEAEKRYGREAVQFGGLRIYTTLDPQLQAIAEQELRLGVSRLEADLDSTSLPLQGALAVVSVPTGEVKALVGARNYVPGGFNRAVSANRHVGSGVKPFIYLAGLEQLGLTPRSVVYDTATTFNIPGSRPWRPRNFDRRYRGPMILKNALQQSINLISANIANQLTPKQMVETIRRFGVTAPIEEVLSVSLGSVSISPMEVAAAYAVIANLGVYRKPVVIKRVEDLNGVVLESAVALAGFGEARFEPEPTYELLDMMKGVIDNGTGRVIRGMGFTAPAAGKTGTSTEATDAWFNGFTTSLSTSVWVGYDRDHVMRTKEGREVDGARGGAPIWANFMKRAIELYPAREFGMPEDLQTLTVDPITGEEVSDGAPSISVVVPRAERRSPWIQ
ncbi:PBP1A family penicillin-binding protein [candidate division KSB1 bacterium]|nr:PBP1A family penicillin-binding protein [candidate division KSB1 bacterium]